MKFNIYVGFIGRKCEYQFTEEFADKQEASFAAKDVAERDALEYRKPLSTVYWMVIPTDTDDIPEDELVGSSYM